MRRRSIVALFLTVSKKVFGFVTVVLTLAFTALSLTGCKQPTDPPKQTLTGITAVYAGTAAVYLKTPVDTLKEGLTVTAQYSNKSSKPLESADYSLSATLVVGSSPVTVSYTEGSITKTTAFTVTVSPPSEYAILLFPVTIPSATYGYGALQNIPAVVIKNIGNKSSGVLSIAVSRQDFILSTTALNSLAADDETFFTVTPQTGLDAGIHSATITVSNTGNGISETLNVSFTVNKADPNVTWPTGLTANYGQTLSAVSLVSYTNNPSGAFSWTEPLSTSVGAVDVQSHNMTFTPTDTANYNTLTQDVNITVNKADPNVTWPTDLTADYGQTLEDISLASYTNSGGTAGAFSWTEPLSTSAGALGVQSHNMTFTPTDTANYNTATQNVEITVVLYRVSFNTNGGGSITNQLITTEETAASRPANPIKNSYVFDYWYTDTGLTIPYNFDTAVTNHITLYAKWVSQSDITAMADKEMIFVPGGSFEMGKNLGSGGGSDVTPVHTVTVSGFYMGTYQTTQAQYQLVMGSLPSQLITTGTYYGKGDNYPVYYVNWYDALVFCNKLSVVEGLTPAYRISNSTDPEDWGTAPTSNNTTWDAVTIDSNSTGYRLPTEAQWEYAAKGGDPTATGWVGYTYAGSDDFNDVAWNISSSGTHEVGTKAPNGLGLYDMSGNVWEWCWDWYDEYSDVAQSDPVGASSGSSVL